MYNIQIGSSGVKLGIAKLDYNPDIHGWLYNAQLHLPGDILMSWFIAAMSLQ